MTLKKNVFILFLFYFFTQQLSAQNHEIERNTTNIIRATVLIDEEDPYGASYVHNYFYIHNDHKLPDAYAGFSHFYKGQMQVGRAPLLQRYNQTPESWSFFANINLIPESNLFQRLVLDNQELLALMNMISEEDPLFSDEPNAFRVKIVIQGMNDNSLDNALMLKKYSDPLDPMTFRPQYHISPNGKSTAEDMGKADTDPTDEIQSKLRIAFLPIDGLPLSIHESQTKDKDSGNIIDFTPKDAGHPFIVNVSIHPANKKKGDFENIQSWILPGFHDDLKQTNEDMLHKPRAFWSVYQQIGPKPERLEEHFYTNPVATLHILIPKHMMGEVSEVCNNLEITTFETWIESASQKLAPYPDWDAFVKRIKLL